MALMDILALLARWAHIGSAIVVVGGTFFTRFILMPAAASLPQAEHDALRERIRKPWQMVVHLGITLFLLSGFFNFFTISIPNHRGDGLYHGLVGTKIILALVVFAIALGVTGRTSLFAFMRQKPKQWLGIALLLATIIVGISGFVRTLPSTKRAPEPSAGVSAPERL